MYFATNLRLSNLSLADCTSKPTALRCLPSGSKRTYAVASNLANARPRAGLFCFSNQYAPRPKVRLAVISASCRRPPPPPSGRGPSGRVVRSAPAATKREKWVVISADCQGACNGRCHWARNATTADRIPRRYVCRILSTGRERITKSCQTKQTHIPTPTSRGRYP